MGVSVTCDPAFAIDADLLALMPRLTRYARYLCRNQADADDLVQDTVLRLLNAARSYRQGTNFSAWACTVMRNLFLTTTRARARKRMVNIDDVAGDLVQRPPSQMHEIEHQDLLDQFMRLPVESRSLLELADGMPYQEIALASGCAVGTVKSRVHRARVLLRDMLHSAYASQRDAPCGMHREDPSPPPGLAATAVSCRTRWAPAAARDL